MTNRVLVAGGAGFVGSHLCDSLIENGAAVTAIDNLSTGSRDNISHLLTSAHFTFIHGDICDAEILRHQGVDRFDEIYHLASPASPDDFERRPFDILRVGSVGTWNLLDLAADHGARILYASTSEVYGDPEIHPQPETYNGNVSPIGPRSCYDEAKRFGEALCSAFDRYRAVEIRIARIFNTYGPRMRDEDGRVISNFVAQAMSGQPVTVFGDGHQTRSFCYVSDLVAGLIQLMNSTLIGPVNLGNPTETSVNELAQTIIEITRSRSVITHVPLPLGRIGDPQRRCPDIRRMSESTGWIPQESLSEGLAKLLHHRNAAQPGRWQAAGS